MKRLLLILFIALASGCSKPKVIPDEELSMIFHDAFLANAYATDKSIYSDSLDLYMPIFEKHGYTVADMQYTIGSFSRRKSARLADIVDAAIKLLDAENKTLKREVAILDTINNVARRAMTREIKSDSLIRVRTLADTSRTRIVVSDLKSGEYEVAFKYTIDSLDANKNLRASIHIEREDSSRTGNYTVLLRHGEQGEFRRTINADSTARRLVVRMLWSYSPMKRPHITYRDFSVYYTPPAVTAVDSLYRQQLDIRIFADEFFSISEKKDSLQSAVPAAGDSK